MLIPDDHRQQPWVPVLNLDGTPLDPCHPARARQLLRDGKATLEHAMPFVIRLTRQVENPVTQPMRLCIDPGSKETGLAIVREKDVPADEQPADEEARGPRRFLIAGFTLEHRGMQIRLALEGRRNHRRFRRGRLRYREERYSNRRPPKGALRPSLKHRVDGVASWVAKLRRWYPITSVGLELVNFDVQRMENASIRGVEYCHGTLDGYTIREWVIEKWGHACVYCGKSDVPLTMDHVIPQGRGSSSRPEDLVPACRGCNEKKGVKSVEEFLAKKPELLAKIKAGLKKSYRDASAVNDTKNVLLRALVATELLVETSDGARTSWNRKRLDVPKTHAIDAAVVGNVHSLARWNQPTLKIKSTGRGAYQRALPDKYGFCKPELHKMAVKRVFGFATGDYVKAVVPKGKRAGSHVGRVAVRSSGSFAIYTHAGKQDGIGHKNCTLLQRADGYGYAWEKNGAAAK